MIGQTVATAFLEAEISLSPTSGPGGTLATLTGAGFQGIHTLTKW